MGIKVRKISIGDKKDKQLLNFLKLLPQKENGFVNIAYGLSEENFSDWIDKTVAISEKEKIEEESVKYSLYWIIYNDEYAGIGLIRELTDKQKEEWSNIGYLISKEYRGKGVASEAVKLLVQEAKEKYYMEKVILSINEDNLASRKIAEKLDGKVYHITETRIYKYEL